MKKKILLGVAFLFILFLAYQRIVNGEKIDKRNALRASEALAEIKKDSITANIKLAVDSALKAEQKVLDYTITEANVLYAEVKSDGTNRDGYAEYLCTILKKNGMSDTRVKIVELGTSKSQDRDSPYGIVIGESDCRF